MAEEIASIKKTRWKKLLQYRESTGANPGLISDVTFSQNRANRITGSLQRKVSIYHWITGKSLRAWWIRLTGL